MMKLPNLPVKNRLTLILVAVVLLVLGGGFWAYQTWFNPGSQALAEEVDLSFDPEGPYALLTPREDGNAMILNLKRVASYDAISYELAYVAKPDMIATPSSKKKTSGDGEDLGNTSGGIDRGVVGNIDTKQKKGEYTQEILFGTCSRNVCKYDAGVENGTLTLHIKKGNKAYRMITQWHLQKPFTALGMITSGDNHFVYKLDPKMDLASLGFTIVNDLSGVAKLPSGKKVLGKVYALNTSASNFPKGDLMLEVGDNIPTEGKLYQYDLNSNNWTLLETKVDGGKTQATANKNGIFAILVDNK